MTNIDRAFVGSIPAVYDRYMRPLIFEPYAQDLAQRMGTLRHHTILETAAGTGVVTAALAAKLQPGEKLLATDLNPAMLAVAEAAIHEAAVSFQPADALSLPFESDSFDLVVCQFGIMFFPDKLAGCREAFRVLNKRGTFLFNVWDTLEFNELASVANATIAKMFPDNPSHFMARTPHGYNDVHGIKATLEAAGFTHVTADIVPKRSHAPSARDAAVGYCQGTPMRNEIESRQAGKLEEATDRCEAAFREKFGTGPIDTLIQAIIFTAKKS